MHIELVLYLLLILDQPPQDKWGGLFHGAEQAESYRDGSERSLGGARQGGRN